jgi:hypothetical protein
MDEETTVETKKGKRWFLPTALLVVVLAGGGYYFYGKSKASEGGNVSNGNVASVAMVNGTAISKEAYDIQLASAVASYKAQGVDVTNAEKLTEIKKQVLINLVNNELLAQAVSAAGIKSNPDEVEKQFQLLLTQTGGADKFKEELAKNNLTESQLRENISKQLAIQAYLLKNVDVNSISVTDDEIEKFYDDYSKAQKASGQKTVPALKEISEQIKQQLVSNKQQALVSAYIDGLQKKAKIEVTGNI